MSRRILAPVIVAIASVSVVRANLVTLAFSGDLTSVGDPSGALGQNPETFFGTHTFDLDLPNNAEPSSSFASFFTPALFTDFTLQIGSFDIGQPNFDQSMPGNSNSGINIMDNRIPQGAPAPRDEYRFSVHERLTSTGTALTDFYFELRDNDATMFSSKLLSEVLAIDMSELEYTFFRGDFIAPNGASVSVEGTISSFAILPAPGAALLGVIGLGMLGCVRRWHGHTRQGRNHGG